MFFAPRISKLAEQIEKLCEIHAQKSVLRLERDRLAEENEVLQAMWRFFSETGFRACETSFGDGAEALSRTVKILLVYGNLVLVDAAGEKIGIVSGGFVYLPQGE